MTKSSRRSFLKTAAIVGSAIGSSGYFVAESNAQQQPSSSTPRLNVACIGVGGKGGSDSNNAAQYGNIVAICDVDRGRLAGRARGEGFQTAKTYTDYRQMLEENERDIDIVLVSGPDHMHGPPILQALRMKKHVFAQKPLARTIYESRLIAEVAKEAGVCTQMGNQGTALDNSRTAISLMQAGIIGEIKEVYAWSNRPVWAQRPGRRENMESFAATAYREAPDREAADGLVWQRYNDIQTDLQNLEWQYWIDCAKYRDYFPGLYHAFQWRGWWDFGSGALGDMACHMLTVPYVAAELKDPTWVRARSTGHDFDSFPASSTIEFEFPATEKRGKIPFWWYDRQGNRPPQEIFARYGIGVQGGPVGRVSNAGVLIIGEEGAMYSPDDYCNDRTFFREGGARIEESAEVIANTMLADKSRGGGNDQWNMWELFRAIIAGDPSIAQSNFVDRAGPLSETILLGNLAVWAAAEGGPDNSMGDWGERIEWDAKNLVVTNLSDLKTPGVAELVKPVYTTGYRLD